MQVLSLWPQLNIISEEAKNSIVFIKMKFVSAI
jgi:hypothetical protein